MSRRTKLCITALFLVLLAVPAIYIALSWAPPAPLEFRYVSHGVPVIHLPTSDDELCVPLKIEVRNTQPFLMHLRSFQMTGLVTRHRPPAVGAGGAAGGRVMARATSSKVNLPIGEYPAFDRVEAGNDLPPIPAHGSMQVEVYVGEMHAQLVDPASLTVEYVSCSDTKNMAMNLAKWMERKLWPWFESTPRVWSNLSPERHHAPLHSTPGQMTISSPQ